MFGITPSNRRNNDIARRNDFFDLRTAFDDFFSGTFFPSFYSAGQDIKADIRETDKEYVIEAEIPGINKDDIRLELRDDVLTIAVERKEEINEERDNFVRKERRYGSYSRSFLVENVRNEEVTAKYDNGVLTIKLPKDEGGRKTKHRIDIQ